MKTKLLFIILALSSALPALSQTPQGFNYQAIARGSDGKEITNKTMQVRLSVLSDTNGYYSTGLGVAVWEEEQSVTTNGFGLFSIVFGNTAATKIRGTVDHFSDINWKMQPLFIGTKINYNSSWKILGTAPLQSVPYSMISGNLSGPVSKLEISASTASGTDDALFEVKNKTGQTIFAVYNQGVRIYVDSLGSKAGTKSGFAIGGFGTVKQGESQPLFIVHPDSIRAYIGTNSGKGLKGGFAIGGFNTSKQSPEEYLRITRDSTRVSVRNPAKGLKGGFAIGGFNASKTTVEGYLNLTPDNYYIGHRSGLKNTSGVRNSVLGYESGFSNTEGNDNVFIGYRSGYSNRLGINNIFIGAQAGHSNIGEIQTIPFYLAYGSENIFIGKEAGYSNTLGWTNLFVGNSSGYGNIDGTDNTFIGNFSGEGNIHGACNTSIGAFSARSNQEGDYNVYVGFYSGNKNTSDHNTFIGAYAGENNVSGQSNTFVGNYAGKSNTGTGNIFIGAYAGMDASGDNMLYIENSNSLTPLIGGSFGAKRVGINRMPTGEATLEVGGNIWANGATISIGATTWSDARYKKDIIPIKGALSDVLEMQGVKYYWNQAGYPELNFNNSEQVGVIAQDIEKVVPQVVITSPQGYKSVSYEKLVPFLIEAIKEQQQMIESETNRNKELESDIKDLRSELEQIKALLPPKPGK